MLRSDQKRELDADAPSQSGPGAQTAARCLACEACPGEPARAAAEPASGPLRGWVLAAVAGYTFLLPVACAVVVASLVRSDTSAQAAAAVLGLGAGMLITIASARIWTRRPSKEPHHG
jgi:hypothetical protein